MKTKITKLPKSEVEIEGELTPEILESFYTKALKAIGDRVEIDGFRKGKVPEKILLEKVGEMYVLEEMATLALSEHYPKILEEEKIDAIGRPEITITKLARNNPLGFKVKTAVIPEIKIADYKKIASKINSSLKPEDKNPEVTEKDVEDTIMDIRKSRAPKIHMKEGEKAEEAKENLPEFNDEFVQALGPFTDVEDFKTKLKENLKVEKANNAREKNRLAIVEEIIKESEIDLPELLITSEVDKILAKMEADISAMGLKFEEYLKHINKKVEDLRTEFRPDGEKRGKLSLVMHEIAKNENLSADPKKVEEEVAMILEHYKDADPLRARAHAENVLTNEQIFQFLENQ